MKLPGLAGTSLNPPANFLNPAAERTLQGLFGAFGPLSTVQVVGDVYLDVIAKIDALPEWDGDSTIKQPIETVAGGSALNTAVQLSALLRTRRQRSQPNPFRRCVLHSRVGADLYGDLVEEKIREAGVALSAKRAGAQGVCICLSGKRDRAFVSYKGSVGELSAADIDERALLAPGTSHLHFSAYFDCAALQPSVPRLMERAKVERGATISVVPQTDPAGEWGSGFLELLPNVDVLICNQREAAAIAGVPFGGDRRPTWAQTDAAVRRLQRAGAPLVVVTLGPEGAIAVSGTKWWYQPNAPLPVTDATGCGDAFAAGFLFGWAGEKDVRPPLCAFPPARAFPAHRSRARVSRCTGAPRPRVRLRVRLGRRRPGRRLDAARSHRSGPGHAAQLGRRRHLAESDGSRPLRRPDAGGDDGRRGDP